MPRQNRVTPRSEIIAHPARGLMMGNRGCLHDAAGRLVRDWAVRRWIICLTDFKGRRRPLMQPGCYSELFFLDEAVALAAGHRPCAECRRADYKRFCAAWVAAGLGSDAGAEAMDLTLHAHRRTAGRAQATWAAPYGDLPDGTFVASGEGAALVRGGGLCRFDPAGYLPPCPRPRSGMAIVLTPAPTVRVLAAGYRPLLHPSALA